MNLPDVKYAIPDEILADTIKTLEFAQSRYEQEAAALIGAALIGAARHEQDEVLTSLGRKLGRERLMQSDRAAELVAFYLNL